MDQSYCSLLSPVHGHYFSSAPLHSQGFTNDPRSGGWNILFFLSLYVYSWVVSVSLAWEPIYLSHHVKVRADIIHEKNWKNSMWTLQVSVMFLLTFTLVVLLQISSGTVSVWLRTLGYICQWLQAGELWSVSPRLHRAYRWADNWDVTQKENMQNLMKWERLQEKMRMYEWRCIPYVMWEMERGKQTGTSRR